MWNREDLKERAKLALKDNGYWKPVLASILFLVLTGSLEMGGNSNTVYRLGGLQLNQYWVEFSRNLPLSAWFWGIGIALAFAYTVLIGNPLTVGRHRYFLEHRSRRVKTSLLFQPFRSGYKNVVKAKLMTDLIAFLWSLLLLVPGIIKSYQYFFVPAILAENPNIPWRRAMRLSRDMTQGNKMEIWVMQLSFFGWLLLAFVPTIACAYWVSNPVGNAFSGLYNQLYALTHGHGQPTVYSWLLGEDEAVQFAQGYAVKFLALHLVGLGLYYLSNLLSSATQVFIAPYYHGSFADLYAVTRARALATGIATKEELPGFGWPDEQALEESILENGQPPKVLVEEQTHNPPE